MTCIVGIAHDGIVYIGGDSCWSNYWIRSIHDDQPKIFKNGQTVIGSTGSSRMCDLLKYKFSAPRYIDGDDIDDYLRTTFIDSVIDCFRKNGFLSNSDDGTYKGGNFIVGIKNRLFEIQSDFSVLNCPSWGCASGSGYISAMGSLHTTRYHKNPIQRVFLALDASSNISSGVSGPFIYTSTEMDDIVQLDEKCLSDK
ncbi:MAG: hypothetical protein WC284_08245 [Candidimonas sp.]